MVEAMDIWCVSKQKWTVIPKNDPHSAFSHLGQVKWVILYRGYVSYSDVSLLISKERSDTSLQYCEAECYKDRDYNAIGLSYSEPELKR